MNAIPTLQTVVEAIATKARVDILNAPAGTRIVVSRLPYMPLVIEKMKGKRIAVAHFNSDGQADPALLIFTGQPHWVPLAIAQLSANVFVRGHIHRIGGLRRVAWAKKDGSAIHSFDQAGQADVAAFVKVWAANIRKQGFIGAAKDATLVGPDQDLPLTAREPAALPGPVETIEIVGSTDDPYEPIATAPAAEAELSPEVQQSLADANAIAAQLSNPLDEAPEAEETTEAE